MVRLPGEATDNAADLPPTDTWAPHSVVGHGAMYCEQVPVERFCPNIMARLPGANDAVDVASFTTPFAGIVGACAKTPASHSTAASVASTILDGFNILRPPGPGYPFWLPRRHRLYI
jgi:hypothetical protein